MEKLAQLLAGLEGQIGQSASGTQIEITA